MGSISIVVDAALLDNDNNPSIRSVKALASQLKMLALQRQGTVLFFDNPRSLCVDAVSRGEPDANWRAHVATGLASLVDAYLVADGVETLILSDYSEKLPGDPLSAELIDRYLESGRVIICIPSYSHSLYEPIQTAIEYAKALGFEIVVHRPINALPSTATDGQEASVFKERGYETSVTLRTLAGREGLSIEEIRF